MFSPKGSRNTKKNPAKNFARTQSNFEGHCVVSPTAKSANDLQGILRFNKQFLVTEQNKALKSWRPFINNKDCFEAGQNLVEKLDSNKKV